MDNTTKSSKSKDSDEIRIEKLTAQDAQEKGIPYTVIPSKIIRHIKDPIAGFVWMYLLSLPPNWIVNKSHIKNKFSLGNNKLKTVFSYLHRCLLIDYHRERFDNGKLGDVSIVVYWGEAFNPDEPYVLTRGSKSEPVVKTTGSKNHPVANQTSGSGPLQILDKYKSFSKSTNTRKDFVQKEIKEQLPPRPQPKEYLGVAPSASHASSLLEDFMVKHKPKRKSKND